MSDEVKKPFGRPTKYIPEYCDLTEYLKRCKKENELPSQVGLAVFHKVAEQTIVNWGQKHPDFLVSLKELLSVEKQILFNKGLTGDYNSTIAKLLLSANHKVIETKEEQHTGKDGGPIAVQIVDYSGAAKP